MSHSEFFLSAGYGGERKYPGAPSSQELGELLVEVRGLRAQLERSVQENGALRVQLEQQLGGVVAVAHSDRRPQTIPVSPQRDAAFKRQLFHGEALQDWAVSPQNPTPPLSPARWLVCLRFTQVLLLPFP